MINQALYLIMGLDNDSIQEYYRYDADEEFPGFRARRFLQWFRDTFTDRIWQKYYEIDQHVQNGMIIVYREISAPADWQPDPTRHPGLFWSWDERAAEAHWGSMAPNQVSWVMVAQVPVGAINWTSTLAKNASFTQEEEKEIELRPRAKVVVLNYYHR